MKYGHDQPIGAVASRVVSRGESFEYKTLDSARDSSVPLPVKDPSKAMRGSPTFINLTGTKFGRLTVLGLSAEVDARWVCRCFYGAYTMRTSKAIKAKAGDASCCQCYLLAVSKRKEYERRTGKSKDTSTFF
ncbi:hypothetical protein PSCICO_12790 [Pseudomonas cichorii]|nr:hypothetical protein PSCICO_12790 [Pseudomonas cichorii]